MRKRAMNITSYLKPIVMSTMLSAFAMGCDSEQHTGTIDTSTKIDLATFNADGVPGFGMSIPNAKRDDTIALWEAYKREVLVKNCMIEANLMYDIEVAFPADVAAGIANDFKLPDPHSVSRSGTLSGVEVNNYKRAMTLAIDEKEKYFQRLYAESSVDVELVETTGNLPQGRADFARGGCVGKSWDAIPGIYALKHKLASDIALAKANELMPRSASVAECELASAELVSTQKADESSTERNRHICEDKSIEVDEFKTGAAARNVLLEKQVLTTSHIQKYANAIKSIAHHDDFLAFLSSSTHGQPVDRMLRNFEEADE